MKALTPYAHRILNDEAAIQKRDLWFSRLQNLFDGKKDAFNEKHIYTVSGICPRPADPFLPYTHPEDWVIECLELLALAPKTQSNRFVPPCVEYPIYGVHFIDKMFGADVFFKDGQWNA
ncbi:MAG: hypothetical protein IJB99_00845, partial [Clostridia bacterium]|nr:hypothetical protein [Clostridia bacterium]